MNRLKVDLESYLERTRALIDDQLDKLVSLKKGSPYAQLFQAARYTLLAPGKRIRPTLALAIVDALGGTLEHAVSSACTLEMIHAYSLVHDDLPSMDNDDFRRGKPSLHKAFPEGIAILTGDFLLTYVFEILARDRYTSAEQKIQLIEVLSSSAGSEGMIGGQIMDISLEGKDIDLDLLRLIHQKKTGALMTAAAEFGGILGGATMAQMHLLRNFGSEIGLAFQIVDDILDAASVDASKSKATYVTLLGVEQCRACVEDLYNSLLTTLNQLPGDTSYLSALAQQTLNRTE